ncbi:Predicted Fe-S protein YdhL, DUF1289 family [Pseudomonas sp. NFACC42-2]|nr:Predicted Fe-S protein YdhL, DUF1289 family [Pseudomonas sp. NFACC42-2]
MHILAGRVRPFTPSPGDLLAKDIENPCVSTCQLSGDLCVSCGRSKDEIRKWKRMKRPEKMAAVQRATQRLKALKKAR